MLTYEKREIAGGWKIVLYYNSVELKCSWIGSKPSVYDYHNKTILQEAIDLINWEVYVTKFNDFTMIDPPNVLTEADLKTIKEMLE